MRNPRSCALAIQSPRALTRTLSFSRSFAAPSVRPSVSCSDAESAWINNAYPRARTAEKSTAVAARGASRTPAIAHTYLYTVIFKMKERRAGGRIVVVVVSVVGGVVQFSAHTDC